MVGVASACGGGGGAGGREGQRGIGRFGVRRLPRAAANKEEVLASYGGGGRTALEFGWCAVRQVVVEGGGGGSNSACRAE